MNFVDTSVLVAIIAREEDGEDWVGKLVEAGSGVTTSLVVLEATMRLTTLLAIEPREVERTIIALLAELNLEIVPIEAVDAAFAVDAFARYGKGRKHPARLNLSDCLSYACARRRGLRLVYKGGDFALTDLA